MFNRSKAKSTVKKKNNLQSKLKSKSNGSSKNRPKASVVKKAQLEVKAKERLQKDQEKKKKSAERFKKAKAKLELKEAGKKAKTKKSPKQSKDDENVDIRPSNIREIIGWVIVLFALVSLSSVVMQFVSQGGTHLFGPWLGKFLATNLLQIFGKFPVLLFLPFLFLFGIKVLVPHWEKLSWRWSIFALLVSVQTSLLLSISNQSNTIPIIYDFINTGGALGNFIMSFVLQPVFQESKMGSYILIGSAFFITLIWGFNWKPSEWVIYLLAKCTEIIETAKLRAQEKADERLLKHSPAAQLIRKKKQEELLKKYENEVNEELLEEIADLIESKRDMLGDHLIVKTSKKKKSEIESIPLMDLSTVIVEDEEKLSEHSETIIDMEVIEERALDARQILAAMSPHDRDALDPRELRRLLDDANQLERARELNKWEVQDKKQVKIEGIISNTAEFENAHEITNEVANEEWVAEENSVDLDKTIAFDVSSLVQGGHKNQPEQNRQTQKMNLNQVPTNLFDKSDSENTEPQAQSTNQPPKTKTSSRPQVKKIIASSEYVIPDIQALLPEPPEQKLDLNPHDLQLMSAQLEAQMANFKVKGKVVGITTGPVITRFEIDLAPGVKVSKISGLQDDLALALKAKSVRILAPIPGKAAVGIEIPNSSSQIVYGKPIVGAAREENTDDQIIIALGKDISGEPYTMDLAKAPHLLIAGQTGSGKSVCINTLMASILATKSPDELKMLLVDPKVVELKPYEDIPHLLYPVITDPELAISALKWACWEMDRRYEVLAKIRVRNLAGFNAKIAKGGLEDKLEPAENKKMPFIVIMIDELADLMMVAGKEVEISISRIAQKARAVGIHLVLATQRPSTNVITGTIKANLPTRICFKVASHIDARTVLDKSGGEKLLGRGDMLFKSMSDPEAVRVHGAFLTDDEIEVITDACSNQNVERNQLESFDFEGSGGSDKKGKDSDPEDAIGPRDEHFHDAAELAVHSGKASASMYQRRLQIGYARAGRLVDQLEAAGIIGPARGAKARNILMTEEELRSFLSGDTDDIVLDDY